MSKWVLAFLCFASVRAFASSADSGRCPWKMPFTIRVHAVGITTTNHTYAEPHGGSLDDYSPYLDSQDFEFTIDTSLGSGITLRADTLQWYSNSSQSAAAIIVFVPGKDSIDSISFYKDEGSSYYGSVWSSGISFTMRAVAFDDTSIYCSAGGNHSVHCSVTSTSGYNQWPNFSWLGDYTSYDFTGLTVSLSGIFRPVRVITDSTFHASPWQDTLQLTIQASGKRDSAGKLIPSSEEISFPFTSSFVDNGALKYSYYHRSSYDWSGSDTSYASLTFYFKPGQDSIDSVSLSMGSGAQYYPNLSLNLKLLYDSILTFSASHFAYDSTGVFSTDSSFCSHSLSVHFYSDTATGISQTFTATSVILSGIFRPTHYTCAASVSEPAQTSESLTVATSNDVLHCTFASSDNPRTLEVYSILGIKAASISIPAGATQGIASHLSPGFYFVRLGNQIAKAIIP